MFCVSDETKLGKAISGPPVSSRLPHASSNASRLCPVEPVRPVEPGHMGRAFHSGTNYVFIASQPAGTIGWPQWIPPSLPLSWLRLPAASSCSLGASQLRAYTVAHG